MRERGRERMEKRKEELGRMWPICFYSTHDDWSDGKMPPSPAGWGCHDLLWAVLITGPSWCKFGVWFYCELLPLLCLSFSPCRREGGFPWVMLLRLTATAYVSRIVADRLNLNIAINRIDFAITVMCTYAFGGVKCVRCLLCTWMVHFADPPPPPLHQKSNSTDFW